jgi:hypothetical protein
VHNKCLDSTHILKFTHTHRYSSIFIRFIVFVLLSNIFINVSRLNVLLIRLIFLNFDSIISTRVPFQFLIYTSVVIKVEVYFWHSCTFVCVMKMSIAVPYYTLIQVKQ